MPVAYHAKQQGFSKHQGQAGMNKSTGFNTAKTTSKVHSHLDGR